MHARDFDEIWWTIYTWLHDLPTRPSLMWQSIASRRGAMLSIVKSISQERRHQGKSVFIFAQVVCIISELICVEKDDIAQQTRSGSPPVVAHSVHTRLSFFFMTAKSNLHTSWKLLPSHLSVSLLIPIGMHALRWSARLPQFANITLFYSTHPNHPTAVCWHALL